MCLSSTLWTAAEEESFVAVAAVLPAAAAGVAAAAVVVVVKLVLAVQTQPSVLVVAQSPVHSCVKEKKKKKG